MRLRVAILEDEPPAVAALEAALRRHSWDVSIEFVAPSIRTAVASLKARPAPDLIFADIRLSDGLSLRVFDEVNPSCPVVFTTAYDEYMLAAFERNAIDYLLKPIEEAGLSQAMSKYGRLHVHFSERLASLRRDVTGKSTTPRILARSGASFVAVPITTVAWFTTQHKLTLLATRDGKRLLVDQSLGDLADRLGPAVFRINRQFLVRADAIASFRPGGRGRLLVTLTPPASDEVQISQEIAAAFRTWLQQ
jgi:DNA-binding LytR/AlgR family response regulator